MAGFHPNPQVRRAMGHDALPIEKKGDNEEKRGSTAQSVEMHHPDGPENPTPGSFHVNGEQHENLDGARAAMHKAMGEPHHTLPSSDELQGGGGSMPHEGGRHAHKIEVHHSGAGDHAPNRDPQENKYETVAHSEDGNEDRREHEDIHGVHQHVHEAMGGDYGDERSHGEGSDDGDEDDY
jgi:hypothetical protein